MLCTYEHLMFGYLRSYWICLCPVNLGPSCQLHLDLVEGDLLPEVHYEVATDQVSGLEHAITLVQLDEKMSQFVVHHHHHVVVVVVVVVVGYLPGHVRLFDSDSDYLPSLSLSQLVDIPSVSLS